MIKTDRFMIRAVCIEDLDNIYTMNEQELRGEFQECVLESKDVLSEKIRGGQMFTDVFQMLLIETVDKETFGLVYLNFPRQGLARIGVVLKPDKRRNGLGEHVTRAVVDYLFGNYPLARIEAETDVQNIAAQRVLERCGFNREGVMRQYRYHHGHYNDSVLYSIIKQNSY